MIFIRSGAPFLWTTKLIEDFILEGHTSFSTVFPVVSHGDSLFILGLSVTSVLVITIKGWPLIWVIMLFMVWVLWFLIAVRVTRFFIGDIHSMAVRAMYQVIHIVYKVVVHVVCLLFSLLWCLHRSLRVRHVNILDEMTLFPNKFLEVTIQLKITG